MNMYNRVRAALQELGMRGALLDPCARRYTDLINIRLSPREFYEWPDPDCPKAFAVKGGLYPYWAYWGKHRMVYQKVLAKLGLDFGETWWTSFWFKLEYRIRLHLHNTWVALDEGIWRLFGGALSRRV